jgi:hypothetical protein
VLSPRRFAAILMCSYRRSFFRLDLFGMAATAQQPARAGQVPADAGTLVNS